DLHAANRSFRRSAEWRCLRAAGVASRVVAAGEIHGPVGPRILSARHRGETALGVERAEARGSTEQRREGNRGVARDRSNARGIAERALCVEDVVREIELRASEEIAELQTLDRVAMAVHVHVPTLSRRREYRALGD